jgi:hypothetical protein
LISKRQYGNKSIEVSFKDSTKITQLQPYIDVKNNHLMSWINKIPFMAIAADGVYPWETYKIAWTDYRLKFKQKILIFGDVIYNKSKKMLSIPFP